MKRIIFGLFVILLMDGQAAAKFPMTLVNLTNIISLADDILHAGSLYCKTGKELNDDAVSEKFNEIFNKVEYISNEYNEFLFDINNIKIETLFIDVNKNTGNKLNDLTQWKLNKLIKTVNKFYSIAHNAFRNKSITYQEIFANFSHTSMINHDINIPNALKKIHRTVISSRTNNELGLFNFMDKNSLNLQSDCNNDITFQQQVYLILISLIITEIKGLIALSYSYSLIQMIDKNSSDLCIDALKDDRKKFEKRVKNYHKNIILAMDLLPRVIYRCEVDPPQRDVNFIEFVNYNQALLISTSTLDLNDKRSRSFNLKCEEIDHSVSDKNEMRKVNNCQTVGYNGHIDVCLADRGTHRKYLWWKTLDRTFGHVETCPNGSMNYGQIHRKNMILRYMCLCSVIDELPLYENNLLYFSETPQMSNIENNMIVVGIKFIVYDRAVHIQIQQSEFNSAGIINNSTVWKKLDDQLNTDEKFNYNTLTNVNGQIYLDDVILPPNFAVTGVKLSSRSDPIRGLALEVHGTPFDLETGDLDVDSGAWFGYGNENFVRTSDYKRDRIEIKMTEPDDPARCRGYNYDEETNKFITVTHDSVVKDAGQSTIPYLDAQPVESHSLLPLNGIGLFYREKSECGGYIAPRIFTIDMSKYIVN